MKTEGLANPPEFQPVADILLVRAGLDMSGRQPELMDRTREAMAAGGHASVESFAAFLKSDQVLLDGFVSALVVGETYFFRENDQFLFMEEQILPELRRRRPAGIRAWSAGCATGEEAYTLAMLFEEQGLAQAAKIAATDISRPSLVKAGQALYRTWSMRNLEPGRLRKHFEKTDGKYRVARRYRDRVIFSYLNLAVEAEAPAPFLGTMDLVLCRNVLIYLSNSAIKTAYRALFSSLAEGGWLVMGPSDPLAEVPEGVRAEFTKAGVFYRKSIPGETHRIPGQAPAARLPAARRAPLPPPPVAKPRVAEASVPRAETRSWLDLKELARRQGAALAELESRSWAGEQPLSQGIHFIRGLLLMELGKDAEAVASFRRALFLDRQLAVVHFAMAMALRRGGDGAGSRRSLRKGLACCAEMAPGDVLTFSEGMTCLQMKQAIELQLAMKEGSGDKKTR